MPFSRFPPQLFRVLLLRRLWFPLPLSSRTCLCGRPLDVLGHHRAACSRAGVLANRGFSVESAVARFCREAGARVSTNLFVRDLDLPVARHDGRRLEVVVDGFPLFNGAHSPLTPHGSLLFVPPVSPASVCSRRTAPFSPKPVALIQNSRAIMAAPGWLFSQLRSEAVGQRLVPSLVSWPERRRALYFESSPVQLWVATEKFYPRLLL